MALKILHLGTKIRAEYNKILKFGPKYKILVVKKIKKQNSGCPIRLDVRIQSSSHSSSVIKGRKASDQPEKGELARRIERRLVVLSASASTLVCTLLPGSSCSSTTQWINVWLRPTAFPDRRLESGLIRWWCWSIHPPESAEPLLRCIIVHQCKTVHWESELKFSN